MKPLTAIFLLLLACAPVSPVVPPPPVLQPDEWMNEALTFNNTIRAAAGKPAQSLDTRLCQAAQEQASWCATHGYTYTSPGSAHEFGNGTMVTRAARYGFYGALAENMAGNSDDTAMAFRQWQESPGHYRNLLGDYNLCGFGVATNPRGERLYFALYGREVKR
jgi:uncharacterized protein YkwD